MSWRPSENWTNPYAKESEYPVGMYAIDKAMFECFEESADAMHEADLKWIDEHNILRHISTNSTTILIEIYNKDWEAFRDEA